jgi:uncharacterized membrane protein YbjE (DUF340 family)
MTQTRPEPLNLKLSRITPAWARPQRARRILVIAMFTLPFAAGTLAGLLSSGANAWPIRVLAVLGVLAGLVCYAWLVGATSARADMPDDYLDERERGQRDQVYRLAFINLMGLIALGFVISRFTPAFERLPSETLIGLLFFVGMLMPTTVLAWIEPDPVQD